MKRLPLARYRAATDPVLLGPPGEAGRTTVAAFFARVGELAAELPQAQYVINICETRAGFMLGFAAALVRGQISLLPAGQSRGDWEHLLARYPGAYLLGDSAAEAGMDALMSAAAAPHFDLGAFAVFAEPGAGETPLVQIPLIREAQTAAILFTSGSTGTPAAHAKTWGQLWRGAAVLAEALDWDNAPQCAIVGSVPPQHMFGLEATVMLAWYAGVPVHRQRPLLAADLGAVLAQYAAPSWWMTTAAHMRAPLSAPAALPKLQGVLASTMSVPVALAAAAESAWQVPVMEIYGSTETGALAIRRPAREQSWLPLPGVLLRSVSAAGDKGAPPAAQQTAAASMQTWAAGAHIEPEVLLGDALELLPDGRFLLGARLSNLVKVGGRRASLAALNQALCEVPGVEDGVYFFADDAVRPAANDEANAAQRPVAFYVSSTLGPQQVAEALRARIDAVFIPRPLYHVAQLPRDANGKLPRAALVELLALCKARRIGDSGTAHRGTAHQGMALRLAIDPDHPALAGHFPDEPIVPGVIILARVAEALRQCFPQFVLGALVAARFHAPLRPAQFFTVHAQLAEGRLRFEVHGEVQRNVQGEGDIATATQLIASGQWAHREARAADLSNLGKS